MTYMICELVSMDVEVAPEVRDEETGAVIAEAVYRKEFVQRDRQASPEEVAEIEARKAAAGSIDLHRAEKLAQINIECDMRMSALVVSYPENEQKTFAKQEDEARAYMANPASATPMIDALALNRGIDKGVLVSRIIAKADLFAQYSGAVIGYRQKLEDEINAAQTVEALSAIDIASGWPV